MPGITRSPSDYRQNAVGTGIVHIGLGAFHRAHQAWYLERWLRLNGGGDWGICAANIRSNRELVETLRARQHRYHVVAYTDRRNVEITEVRAIRETLFAGDQRGALLERLADPGTRIVSLTVTEKGYHLNPATGKLDTGRPDVAHDIAHPATPVTAPGLLVEALRRRRERGLAPFTVLSCDNMPDNGARTRTAVTTLAAQGQDELAAWIDAHVPFPSTMVDRIVPAVTATMRHDMAALIGADDPAAVACEAFSQWVVEDRFAAGRPDWERVGVGMVDDVGPYETLKLRLLNGAHSLLAYAGLACGRTTVSEAIADPAILALVREYFTEAAASLDPVPGISPTDYAGKLLERFGNDALEHRLTQIAMDGSQKLPQRWLDGAGSNLAQGRSIRATAIGLAAWFAHVRGRDDEGHSWRVDDPLAERLAQCHRGNTGIDDQVFDLLGIDTVFAPELAADAAFRNAVLDACRRGAGGIRTLLRA